MTIGHGTQHISFGKLGGLGFNHQHTFTRTGNNQIKAAFFHFGKSRVQHIFAVDHPDAGTADGAKERNAGNRQCSRSTHHGNDTGIIFHVMRQHGTDHLGIAFERFREQRTDRPVNQTGDQRFAFGRTTFTLEKAAGNFTRGEGLFLIINGKGEEILPRLRRSSSNRGTQHCRLTHGGQHSTIRLTGDTACFKGQHLAAPFDFFLEDLEHPISFLQNTITAPCHDSRPHQRDISFIFWGDEKRRVEPYSRGPSRSVPADPKPFFHVSLKDMSPQ